MKTLKIIIFALIILFPVVTNASIENDINKIRQENNLTELKIDKTLTRTSAFKVNDMIFHQYFSYTNKFGDDVLDIFNRFNVKFNYAGEILAKGYNSKEVVNAWLNSPSHKSVILDKDFKNIGCYERNYFITCQFSN